MKIENWGQRELFLNNGIQYEKIQTGFCYKYILNDKGKYVKKLITFKEYNEAYKNKQ